MAIGNIKLQEGNLLTRARQKLAPTLHTVARGLYLRTRREFAPTKLNAEAHSFFAPRGKL
jgi:hypothetical protein